MKLYINPNIEEGHINRAIYGHFTEHLGRCIYEGIYVGEDSKVPNTNGIRNDVIEAMKAIKVPVLRWPGGCFADTYHWQDGIGPKAQRKRMINVHWGGVVEDNSFGTHEFMKLCELVGCEAYISGNLGSGTVQEMSDWLEYMTFDGESPMADLRRQNGQDEPWRVKYFGVGNESWGCGGNMTPESYGNMYRRYQTYLKPYGANHDMQKICCGPNCDDYTWTKEVLETCYKGTLQKAHGLMDGLSLHYYTVPGPDWSHKGSATAFSETDWYATLSKTLYMEELIKKHSAIMDTYDPEQKIGLIVDEWGTWYDVEPGTNPGFLYQQNTMRDAMVAAINLNIFNKHCKRVHMANLAQAVNVLQAIILTEGEKMVLTPTYYVFEMYKAHQDATLVASHIKAEPIGVADEQGKMIHPVPNVTQSVSKAENGELLLTLCNLSLTKAYDIEGFVTDWEVKAVQGKILTAKMDDYNSFLEPDKVRPETFKDYTLTTQGINFKVPPCSIVQLVLS